jgi:hypothetical protein
MEIKDENLTINKSNDECIKIYEWYPKEIPLDLVII